MSRSPKASRVVQAYLEGEVPSNATAEQLALRVVKSHLSKTAGEVRHVKDTSGDASSWAYATHGPSEREMDSAFVFDPEKAEDLAIVLRSTVAAMAHAISAQNHFAQLKSRNISPDGSLGGRGYIQKISDMRHQFFNIVEALSAMQDTLYDEVHAPHWTAISREDESTQEVLEQTDEIREDPSGWADEELDGKLEEQDHGKA